MEFWRIMQFFHVPVGVRHQLCFCQINLFCLQLLDGRFLEHFISSLNFYQGPKAWKIAEWVCIVNFVILYIMFQPSDLTTATKVFIEFNMGFLCRATMVQCINVKVFVSILQKCNWKIILHQILHKIINMTGLYFFLTTLFVNGRGKSKFFYFLLTVSFMSLNYLWFDKILIEVECHLIQFKFKRSGLIKNCFVFGSKFRLKKISQ